MSGRRVLVGVGGALVLAVAVVAMRPSVGATGAGGAGPGPERQAPGRTATLQRVELEGTGPTPPIADELSRRLAEADHYCPSGPSRMACADGGCLVVHREAVSPGLYLQRVTANPAVLIHELAATIGLADPTPCTRARQWLEGPDVRLDLPRVGDGWACHRVSFAWDPAPEGLDPALCDVLAAELPALLPAE